MDPFFRPQRQAKGGGEGGDDDGDDGCGETGAGSELFLAVGTGPFRQADDPIDEVCTLAACFGARGRGRGKPERERERERERESEGCRTH